MYSVPVDSPSDRPLLRIGELSRRLGVSDHALRAWESRYGLLQPVRSPGGFRLYSEADESRIRRMQAYLADGLSAAEAARAALDGGASPPPGRPAGPPPRRWRGVSPWPRSGKRWTLSTSRPAQAVLDRLVADLSLPAVLRDIVLPYLADLGERWRAARPASPRSIRQQPPPRSARGAGPRLGERARTAGPACLPARRTA